MMHCILSLIIWTPIVIGLLVAGLERYSQFARCLAILGAFFSLALSVCLFARFDATYSGLQFVQHLPWISSLNINYYLAVDGISLPFILLNNFITLLVIILGLKVIKNRPALYNGMFLVMTGAISGAFCSMDAILFYIFFEAMLIPLYLIIGVWGGANRVYAAIKFFLYTFFGSLLMLVAFIYLYFVSGKSFEIMAYYHTGLGMLAQIFLFIGLFLAFAIKVPMFPLHTWLPDTYTEAPVGGTIALSAVTVKLGGYGFLRFVLPILPDASHFFAGTIIILSLIGIVYFSLIAIIQKDMKRMMAYSSVAHMGFVTLASFLFVGTVLSPWAVEGALMQMLSHGFVAAGMFVCVGILYHRLNSNTISDFGGVVNKMPIFAAFTMLFAMANIGLPGTSGFVGEFLVIMAAIQVKFIYGFIAATTLILSAAYTLWLYKKAIFGDVVSSAVANLKDVDLAEFIVLALLALLVLLIGVYPDLLAHKMQVGIRDLVINVANNKAGLH